MEMTEKVFNQADTITTKEKQDLVDFLYEHLDEYGDKKEHIANCIDYAMNSNPLAGGFIVEMLHEGKIVGALVMNKTGMSGYIPENILVYIAVNSAYRGQGIGRKIMERSMQLAKGDVALHVEQHNPANFLYKKMGFTNPYLEMRLYRDGKPSRADD
ncbi:MAG: GNAT family N-acetyltransferase [Bacteroidales bacterium]|jgi:GNAT superfamily N-acetyltransferase|nr:GNAT family N-acetyltransferase [Bacteroidales bacterium]NCU35475.1 N-acetyltransferase [Candidatus Falkowbacteria bacterium]MDD2632201.1 GNAT family N-acetyltransferase [Bacteroidales bacterium]MDD3131982.1 GNAT family N-acetyltransferase [Bacteroidales bacterium]MDD3526252.1 GNAT family N-acetyltransferase [Bacteroidales bacterium]